jgi:hypothetical protein
MVNPAINGWAIFKNPNGIQIHQPRVGGPRRTGESVPDGPPAPTLGNRSPNSSTLKALNQIHRHLTANHANHAKIKTGFPCAYLAYFAVRPPRPHNSFRVVFVLPRSPSVAATRQRWAECCNRVAVGRAELLLRLGFGRRSTVALPTYFPPPNSTANHAI